MITLRLRAERAAWLAHLGKKRTVNEAGLTAGGLAENLRAAAADNHRLGVREHSSDSKAARALDVHEERVGALNQTLELVAASLLLGRRVDEIDGESLVSVAYTPLWMCV